MLREHAELAVAQKKDPEHFAPGQELQWYFWKSGKGQRSVLIRCPAVRCLGSAAVAR